MALTGKYVFRDINGKDVIIFCDFRGDYGYTFFSSRSLSNLSSLLLHYTTRSEAIIRNFRTDGSQQEATVKIISRYESQYNLTFLLNGLFDGIALGRSNTSIDEPFLTLGFVPPSFGNKRGTIQGYKVEGRDIEFNNCDTNPANSIKFFQAPLISGTCCSSNVKSAWYDYAVPVQPGHELPVDFSFKFCVRMGGCGASWSYDDIPNGVEGAALGLKFTLND